MATEAVTGKERRGLQAPATNMLCRPSRVAEPSQEGSLLGQKGGQGRVPQTEWLQLSPQFWRPEV